MHEYSCDEFINFVLTEEQHILCESRNYKHPKIHIYIETELWMQMMKSLNSKGLLGADFEIYATKGTTVFGYPIHKVNEYGHGVKVLEER